MIPTAIKNVMLSIVFQLGVEIFLADFDRSLGLLCVHMTYDMYTVHSTQVVMLMHYHYHAVAAFY